MSRRTLVFTAAALALPVPAAAQTPQERVRVRTVIATVTPERHVEQRVGRPRPEAREHRESRTERITRTLNVGERGELLISNLSGDIVVTRGAGGAVTVEAIKTARARTEEEAREMLGLVEVAFAERAGRAEVRTLYPSAREGRPERRNVNVSVSYTVTAPEHTQLALRSLSGDIRVTDIKGEVSATTTSGDVTIRNGGRVANARSTSGDVEITDTASEMPFQAHSTSGDVTIRNVRVPRIELGSTSGSLEVVGVEAERVTANTLSGDVLFDSSLAKSGRYTLKSHSGDVRIVVSGNAGFELDAQTFSGTIRSDVPLKTPADRLSLRGERRSIRGIFGDASALVDVTTFSGDVVVRKK